MLPNVSIIDLSRIKSLTQGTDLIDEDIELLRYLNAIMNNETRSKFVNCGTQYFHLNASKVQGQMTDGSLMFRGFTSSTKICEMGIALNLDLVHGIFQQG